MRFLAYCVLTLLSQNVFSQTFEGKYMGSFQEENTFLHIDYKRNAYTILIIKSSGETYFSEGHENNNLLKFEISIGENPPSAFTLSKNDNGLILSFFSNGNEISALFQSQEKKVSTNEALDQDKDLVGKWIQLVTYDADGKVFEAETKNKKYYTVFTEDGRMIVDPRMFRDNFQKHGLDFSYSDIPNFTWKVQLPNILIISVPQNMSYKEMYRIKGDTLVTTTNVGYRTIFVREK